MMFRLFRLFWLPCLALPAHAALPASEAGASPLWGLLQVMLALGLVLALIIGAAWLFRRVSMGGMLGSWQPAKVVSGVMVGPHERVVIVELQGQWLVLGVTAQQVNLLSTMDKPDELPPGNAADMTGQPFAERLAAALSKYRHSSNNKKS